MSGKEIVFACRDAAPLEEIAKLRAALEYARDLLIQTTDGDTVTEGWKRRRDAFLASHSH